MEQCAYPQNLEWGANDHENVNPASIVTSLQKESKSVPVRLERHTPGLICESSDSENLSYPLKL